MRIAARLGVERAPFFLVEEEGQPPRVYTVYLKFVQEVLGAKTTEQDEIKDLMDNNPDVDYL